MYDPMLLLQFMAEMRQSVNTLRTEVGDVRRHANLAAPAAQLATPAALSPAPLTSLSESLDVPQPSTSRRLYGAISLRVPCL